MNKQVIGIDVGGTWVRVARIDSEMNVVAKTATKTTSFKTVDEYLTGLSQMISVVDPEQLATEVGMIVPIPWKDGMTHFQDATNVPFLENIAIDDIRNHFPHHQVLFENDVNVVALLESQVETRKKPASLVYITVSTGIGSGIVVNNQIWQGAKGYAGEVGNMTVYERNRNVVALFEDVCSGSALDAIAKTYYGADATSQHLFAAYEQKDDRAIETIDIWLETFSSTLASLMHVINPELFVLGGAVICHNQWLVEEIVSRTRPKLFENLRPHLKVELSYYGSDSGVLGGAHLCFRNNFQHSDEKRKKVG